MLTDPGTLQYELTRAKENLSSTERALETMRVASERNVDRLQRVEDYRRQRDEARATVAELETKMALMLRRAEIAEEKGGRFESEVIAAESSSRETQLKYEALLKLRDRDLRISSHSTRKNVKGIGASVVNQKGEYPDFNAEAANMEEDLSVVKGKLAAMPLPSLDLADLARIFEDSPPPSK
ncbi:unnamed protein product [Cochlearia groenlandica]